MPEPFVERPVEFQKAKAALLGMRHPGPSRVGIVGIGGAGKSILAVALAHDDQVQKQYRDGVAWVDIGKDPQITERQAELARSLGREQIAFVDSEAGRAELGRALAERACLIVLDDVWDVEHFRAFDSVGPRCGFVFTTRDAGLVRSVGARPIEVRELQPEDGLRFLARWAGEDAAGIPGPAREVADRLGNLPLGLAIAGAMAKGRSARWADILTRLQQEDLHKIVGQLGEYPYPNLLVAIQASVDDLDSAARDRYYELAIFQGRWPVPDSAIEALWAPSGLSGPDVRDLIAIFEDRSLLRRDESGHVTMHDLQVDLVASRLRGDKLVAANNRLLDGYQRRAVNGWPSGPDDGYYFQRLPFHLTQAARTDDLRRLLMEFDWLIAKLRAAGATSLLADYADYEGDDPRSVVRAALLLSIRALVQDPTQLAGQLVGRLLNRQEADIQKLVSAAQRWRDTAWLSPVTASLTPPGSPLGGIFSASGGVTALAMTPDGRQVVAGCIRSTMLYDLVEGQETEYRLASREYDEIKLVSITPDGRRLITYSPYDDGLLPVWDVPRRVVERRLVLPKRYHSNRWIQTRLARSHSIRSTRYGWHVDWLKSIVVSPDSRNLIGGFVDGAIHVWDLVTGSVQFSLEHPRPGQHVQHEPTVLALAVTSNGQHLIAAYSDEKVIVWNLADRRLERIITILDEPEEQPNAPMTELDGLNGSRGMLSAAAMPSGGTHVVCLRSSYGIHFDNTTEAEVWNVASGRLERRLVLGSGLGLEHSTIALSANMHTMVVCSTNVADVWDLTKGQLQRSLPHDYGFLTATISPDGHRVITGSGDGIVRIWHLGSLPAPDSSFCSLQAAALTRDGRHGVLSCRDGTIEFCELKTGYIHHKLTDSEAIQVATMPDGYGVRILYADGRTEVWRVAQATCDSTVQLMDFRPPQFRDAHWLMTEDGSRIVSCQEDGPVQVWDATTGKLILSFSVQRGRRDRFAKRVTAVAMQNSYLIIGFYDGLIQMWDTATGRLLHAFSTRDRWRPWTYENKITALASGKRDILVGFGGGRIELWDLLNHARSRTLKGDSDDIITLAMSREDRVALSGGNRTIRVWDLMAERIVAQWLCDSRIVVSAAVFDGGLVVACGDRGGAVHLLRLQSA